MNIYFIQQINTLVIFVAQTGHGIDIVHDYIKPAAFGLRHRSITLNLDMGRLYLI